MLLYTWYVFLVYSMLLYMFLLYMCVVVTLTRVMKSVVTGQAPATLEWRNTPGKKHTNNANKKVVLKTSWGSQDAQNKPISLC